MEYIFNLLVDQYKIDSNRLWVTVFSGDDIFGQQFPRDKEILELWEKLLPNKEHIVSFGKEYNFWIQGGGAEIAIESKLCGPQTEIFYDLGKKIVKKPTACQTANVGDFSKYPIICLLPIKLQVN